MVSSLGARLLVGLLMAVIATGCSNSDTADPPTPATGATTGAPAGNDGTTTNTAPTTTVTTTAPTTTTSSSTTTVPRFDGPSVPRIDVITPPSGGGPRPDLAWEPVPGTELYLVTVFAPSGAPYWGWQGTETSVPVGGRPRLEPDAAGPSITAGMTWQVTASGPGGEVLASSGRIEITP
jgi:hypothetical protein